MTIIRPGKPVDLDHPIETEVEGEIREFVRRDVATLRRTPMIDSGSDLMANNVNSLVQRVATASVQEIDKLIAELQTLRAVVRHRMGFLHGFEFVAILPEQRTQIRAFCRTLPPG